MNGPCRQCVGQESNLHSNRGRVTAAWARRCPADTSCQYSRQESNLPRDLRRVACRRYTSGTSLPVDRRGIAPRFPPCRGGVFLLDEQPICGPEGRRVNDGARTHLHRLHRPAAHCVAFIHHRGPEGPESPRQDLNLRSPAPEAGALVPYATRGLVQLGSRGSNPDFLVNSQARYRYNTPQFRAPSGSRTRTPCVGSRKAAATS